MSNNHAARDILTYPYWTTDKTQDPGRIAGGILARELQDIGINQEPGRTNYSQNYIQVLMRPAIKQDTSQMTNQADHLTYGVTNPGGMFAALLAGVPDPTPTGKGSPAGAPPPVRQN